MLSNLDILSTFRRHYAQVADGLSRYMTTVSFRFMCVISDSGSIVKIFRMEYSLVAYVSVSVFTIPSLTPVGDNVFCVCSCYQDYVSDSKLWILCRFCCQTPSVAAVVDTSSNMLYI